MNNLEIEFEKAVKKANDAKETKSKILTNDQLLGLYGLFKQAIKGDNQEPEPGIFNPTARYKHQAWKACAGYDARTAMRKYIKMANSHFGPTS
jgi:diazepam-binding inhibitor (GABA receptor modulating acyl-CoA-binding protein)